MLIKIETNDFKAFRVSLLRLVNEVKERKESK